MPPTPYDEKSNANSEASRVRESVALDLPVFDSLPAAANLSNLEAFRLSQRHALALLPALLAQGRLDWGERKENDFLFVRQGWECRDKSTGRAKGAILRRSRPISDVNGRSLARRSGCNR